MRPIAVVVIAAFLCDACGGDTPAIDAALPVADASPPDAAPRADAWIEFAGTITGRVITPSGAPVAGAKVKFGGQPDEAFTDGDGRFSLQVGAPVRIDRLALTAGAVDHWNAGLRVEDPTTEQEIVIEPVSLVDNPGYVFKDPATANAAPFCLHCHPYQVAEWAGSGHAQTARNPKLHDLYNGTASGITTQAACEAAGGAWRPGQALGAMTAESKCYVGAGLLPDLNAGVCGGPAQPTCDDPGLGAALETSVCADCHAPAGTDHQPGATDLNDVTGTAFDDGVHCDFCHKIRRVTVNERPGVNGAIELIRPATATMIFSDPEIMVGPYSDTIVAVMGASYQPQFRTSELCSACHQWSEPGFRAEDMPLVDLTKWPAGLPIQDTYHEWAQSGSGYQCQNCHEPGVGHETATIDLGGILPDPWGTRGWPRPLGEVREHSFVPRVDPVGETAPGDPARSLLRDPVEIEVTATRDGAALDVSVALTNDGVGHSIPSGTPSRALVLLVEARAGGTPLEAIGGYTVPPVGGAHAGAEVGAFTGSVVTGAWPGVAPGAVARFVRPTGSFADYPATRWFDGRTPAEKGAEIVEPVATAVVLSATATELLLDREVTVPAGTRLYLGDAAASGAPEASLAPAALAGAPGWAFTKTMRDRDGNLDVPFFRAVDVASDNRIPAGATVTTAHRFAAPAGAIEVTVTLLYRRHPWATARERGWDAVDVVRARRIVTVP